MYAQHFAASPAKAASHAESRFQGVTKDHVENSVVQCPWPCFDSSERRNQCLHLKTGNTCCLAWDSFKSLDIVSWICVNLQLQNSPDI